MAYALARGPCAHTPDVVQLFESELQSMIIVDLVCCFWGTESAWHCLYTDLEGILTPRQPKDI